MKKKCEICGKPSEMYFNCLLPSFGMLSGDICFDCYENTLLDDMEIAIRIIKCRLQERGLVTPVEPEVIVGILQRKE